MKSGRRGSRAFRRASTFKCLVLRLLFRAAVRRTGSLFGPHTVHHGDGGEHAPRQWLRCRRARPPGGGAQTITRRAAGMKRARRRTRTIAPSARRPPTASARPRMSSRASRSMPRRKSRTRRRRRMKPRRNRMRRAPASKTATPSRGSLGIDAARSSSSGRCCSLSAASLDTSIGKTARISNRPTTPSSLRDNSRSHRRSPVTSSPFR